MTSRRLLTLLLLAAAASCTSTGDDAGPPDELQDGKMDDADYVANGPLAFDEEQPVDVLLGGAHFHSWTFELHGAATLGASTGLLENDHLSNGPLDTAVAIYRHNGFFWMKLAVNDDPAGDIWGTLDGVTATAGRYLVLVYVKAPEKAYPFAVRVTCLGDGCAAPAPQ